MRVFTPDRDLEYLGKLQDFYAEYRNIPSYSRIGEVIGLAAKSAVLRVLERLEQHGFLRRGPDSLWIPTDQFFERHLASVPVRAGMPSVAQDVATEPYLIDQQLIRHPSKTTLVPVKGDSMIEAGIHEGDVAVVERRPAANPGDIVVAIVDNEFTLKTLGRENGEFILLPANKAYPVIRPKGDLEIFGVLVGLIRQYKQ